MCPLPNTRLKLPAPVPNESGCGRQFRDDRLSFVNVLIRAAA